MTIAIITKSLSKDGIGTVIMNTICSINDSFTIIVNDKIDPDYKKICHQKNVKIVKAPQKSHAFSFYQYLQNHFKKTSYDVIHIHGNSAFMSLEALAAKNSTNAKIITHCHNTSNNHRLIHYAMRPVLNHLSDIKIACGTESGKWAYGNSPFIHLQNSIDLPKYQFDTKKRTAIHNQYSIKNNFIIGHVGRFNEIKNQKFLIDLIETFYQNQITDIKLMLIGTGKNLNHLKKYASNLPSKEQIIFVGETTDVSSYYSAFDLFTLPSLYEGMPIVLIEAQANGLSSIVSNTVTNEVNYTNQCTFAPLSNQQWYHLVLKAYQTSQKNRAQVSARSIKILKQNGYDLSANIKTLERIYHENA